MKKIIIILCLSSCCPQLHNVKTHTPEQVKQDDKAMKAYRDGFLIFVAIIAIGTYVQQ